MKTSNAKPILLGLAVAFSVLFFVAFLFLASADQENKNAAAVVHTRDVLDKIDETINSLSDAEAGRRGYILSGQQRYRSHFTNQVEHAFRALDQLRDLTKDNLPQTAACDQLQPLIRQRLTISTNSIQAREDQGLDTVAQTAFMGQGQTAMDSVRHLAAEMANRESKLLKERLEVQDKNIKGTEGFGALLGLCGLFLFIALFVLCWRIDARRRLAEQSLELTNRGLEQRVRDRTEELSQSEKRLAQERNLLRIVIDNLPACIDLKDASGRYIVNNVASLRAMNAASEGETVAKTVFDFFPKDIANIYDADDREVLGTGSVRTDREMAVKNLSGERRWLLATKIPLRDSHGIINGLLGISQDITERKEAEKKLLAQLARLDLLSHTTRAIAERQDLVSIFQVVLRSLEDNLPIDFGCICLYEPNAPLLSVAAVGSRSRVLAQELELTEPARIDIDKNGISRCCLHGELVYEPDISQVDFPFPRRLARSGLAALVIAPLLVESQVFGVLVAARKQPRSFSSGECEFLRQLSEHVALASHQAQIYTALQQAYEDLRKTQQAVAQQERLRALGQMASGIAHDINNAISPVAIYSEFLLENEKGLSDRAREYLGTISSAIQDVAATVVRMREFYRQREPQLSLAPVKLNDLVEQVVNLTRARWSDMPQQRGTVIEAQIDLAKDLPEILGVENEIRDAVTNLILNAVDAMPEGGKLTLRTRIGERSEATSVPSSTPSVCLEVIDTGLGMTEETRRHCLEPFFTTKGERGTGLGLAMVYGMAQRHGADIEIDTALGKGTTMRLRFPPHTPKVQTAASAAEPMRSAPVRMRVLVVDDDLLLLKSVCDALEGDGHLVVTANGGQAGIDAFSARFKSGDPFNVVITDLGMPYIDGRRVAATIKGISSSTPIILLTGWGHRLLAEGDVPENIDRVLSKPPKLADLRNALAQCAQSRPPES